MKRILSILLVLLLSLTVMTGCGLFPDFGLSNEDLGLPCVHDYDKVVTEPTCTETGITTYTCTICGDSYTENETAALGHNYVDGICTVCDAKDPNYVPPVNEDADLRAAYDYIHQNVKDIAKVTGASYEVIKMAAIGDKTYQIKWEVSDSRITIEPGSEDKLVKIVIPKSSEEFDYTLKFTVTNEKGETLSREYVHTVPVFGVNTFEEYMAAKEGDNLTVMGIVVAINSKAAGNSRNHLFLADPNVVGGYYSYQMDKDPVADLGIEVGMTVIVTGPATPYSGMMEIKGGVAEIIDTNKKTVDFVDVTNDFANGDSLGKYTALPVVIKGVTIGGQELGGTSDYLFFELNGRQSYIRTYVTDFPTTLVKDDKATIDSAHAAHFGWTADVYGIVVLYSNNPYLIPLSVDCFNYLSEIVKTPAEKVEAELGAVKVTDSITADGTIALPAPQYYADEVTFVWSSNSEYAVVDGNNLTVSIPDAGAEVVLTLNVTCGEATASKEFTVKLSKDPISILEAIAIGAAKEHDTYTDGKYFVAGYVIDVYNTKYGNMKIQDAAGNILTVYGTYSADGSTRYDAMTGAPVAGDYIVVLGILGQYNDTPQMKNGWIVSVSTQIDIPGANDIASAGESNVYTEDKYVITGEITEIQSNKYGNLYIKDAEGNTFYIYGLYSENGKVRFDAMTTQPAVGDTITVLTALGNYKGTPQGKNAWLIAHTVSGGSGDHEHNFVDGKCECGAEDPNYNPGGTEPPVTEGEIVFDFGENGDAAHVDGTEIAGGTKTYTSNGYELILTDVSKVYDGAFDAKGNSALKFGTSSLAGTMTFVVPENVQSVVIYAACYKGYADNNLIVVNGTTYELTATSANGEYEAITVDTSVNKTVVVASAKTSGKARIMINTITFVLAQGGENPPACEHVWDNGNVTAPTCAEAGYTTYTCTLCGETKKDNEVSATGNHSYVDGTCTVCGEKDPSYTPSLEYPVVNELNNGDVVIIGAPAYYMALSSTKTGYYNVGVDYYAGFGSITDAELFVVTVNADGTYTFTSKTGVVIAMAASNSSLNNDGENKSWTLTAKDGATGIFYLQNTVRGTYLEWYASKNNWSTYNGTLSDLFELSFYLVEAGQGSENPPACEHNYEPVVTDPTCAEAGYTTYTCSLCGDSYVADEVPATGNHSYVDGVCTVCGAEDPDYVALEGEGTQDVPYVIPQPGDYVAAFSGGYNFVYYQMTYARSGGYYTISSTSESAWLMIGTDSSNWTGNNIVSGEASLTVYVPQGVTCYFAVADKNDAGNAADVPFTVSFEAFTSEPVDHLVGTWAGQLSSQVFSGSYTLVIDENALGTVTIDGGYFTDTFTISCLVLNGTELVVFATNDMGNIPPVTVFNYDAESDTLVSEIGTLERSEGGDDPIVNPDVTYDTVIVIGNNVLYFSADEIAADLATRVLNITEAGTYSFKAGNLFVSSVVAADGTAIAKNEDYSYTLAEGEYTLTFSMFSTYSVQADTAYDLVVEAPSDTGGGEGGEGGDEYPELVIDELKESLAGTYSFDNYNVLLMTSYELGLYLANVYAEGYDLYFTYTVTENEDGSYSLALEYYARPGVESGAEYVDTVLGYDIVIGGSEEEPGECEHNYESFTSLWPTCSTTGIETYTCTLCGDSYTEELPVDTSEWGHNYWVDWNTKVEPTCQTDGYEKLVCQNCGDEQENIIPASSEYCAWETDMATYVEPTCTTDGYSFQTCSVCGETRELVLDHTLFGSHSYELDEESFVAATCASAGYEKWVCTACGDFYENELEPSHDYADSANYSVYTCSLCGDVYFNATVTNPDMEEAIYLFRGWDGTLTFNFYNSNDYSLLDEYFDYSIVSVSENVYTLALVARDTDSYGLASRVVTVTVLENGITVDISAPGGSLSFTNIEEEEEPENPTISEVVIGENIVTLTTAQTYSGVTVTFTAPVDGTFVFTMGANTMVGYDYSNYFTGESFELTLVAGDVVELVVFTEDWTPGDATVIVAEAVEVGCAHEGLVHMDAVEAACHQAGNVEYWYCADCKTTWSDEALTTTIEDVTVPATAGLTYVAAVEASCHQNGYAEYWYCTECEAVFSDAQGIYLTNVRNLTIPYTAEIAHVDAVEANCHQTGNVEYWYCTECDAVFTDAALTQISNRLSVVVPATAEIVHVEAVDATCTENGNLEYWYCSECNYLCTDAALTQTSNYMSCIVPATGHTEGAEATCTTAQTCTACGATLVAALGHNYVDYVCDICGQDDPDHYFEMSITDALAAADGKKVSVSGTVSAINTAWSDSYGNISVTITDADGNSLYLYRLKTNVALGDIITVNGAMATHNSSRQIAAGATAEITGHDSSYDYAEMSITEALAAADNTNVIVTGTVVNIETAYSSSYNNISVYIADENGNQLYLYRLTGNVALNDVITVKGSMATYNGARQLTGGTFEKIGTHTCENFTEATCKVLSACVVCGATTGELADHNYVDGTCSVCGHTEGAAEVETITASKSVSDLITEYGWTSSTTKQSFTLDDNVSVQINGGSNTGKAYNSNHIRIYATDSPAGTITISVPEGYELVSVKISTQTGTYAFLYVDGTTTDICNVSTEVSGTSVVLNSVKNGTNGKQVRVTAFEVVYKPVA